MTVVPPELPSPPRRRGLRWPRIAAASVVATGVLLVGGFTIHLPAFTAGPGPARDVGKLIKVTGHRTFPSKGAFLLTTVAVSNRTISLFEALQAWLDPAVSVVDRDQIIRPGLNDRQQDVLNRHDMEESKEVAEVVAFRALGFRVPRAAGARVVTTVPESPASRALRQGDIIVSVGRTTVKSPEDASEAIAKLRIGQRVRVVFRRGTARRSATLRTVESFFEKGRASIGATLGDAYRLPFEVHINTEEIGGPSGGLVFALAVADALTRQDLTRGHRVAATGTISIDGGIGVIGGMSEKILAAERARADVFIVPAEEEAEAHDAAGGSLRIIGVRTLEDAIRALRALPPKRSNEKPQVARAPSPK